MKIKILTTFAIALMFFCMKAQEGNKISGRVVDKFADIDVLSYDVPGWDKLTLKEKQLVYFV